MKTIVNYSGNGLVFGVVSVGGDFMVVVKKYNVGLGSYKVVDVMSCDDEADARSSAWALSMPDGYTGV